MKVALLEVEKESAAQSEDRPTLRSDRPQKGDDVLNHALPHGSALATTQLDRIVVTPGRRTLSVHPECVAPYRAGPIQLEAVHMFVRRSNAMSSDR